MSFFFRNCHKTICAGRSISHNGNSHESNHSHSHKTHKTCLTKKYYDFHLSQSREKLVNVSPGQFPLYIDLESEILIQPADIVLWQQIDLINFHLTAIKGMIMIPHLFHSLHFEFISSFFLCGRTDSSNSSHWLSPESGGVSKSDPTSHFERLPTSFPSREKKKVELDSKHKSRWCFVEKKRPHG